MCLHVTAWKMLTTLTDCLLSSCWHGLCLWPGANQCPGLILSLQLTYLTVPGWGSRVGRRQRWVAQITEEILLILLKVHTRLVVHCGMCFYHLFQFTNVQGVKFTCVHGVVLVGTECGKLCFELIVTGYWMSLPVCVAQHLLSAWVDCAPLLIYLAVPRHWGGQAAGWVA